MIHVILIIIVLFIYYNYRRYTKISNIALLIYRSIKLDEILTEYKKIESNTTTSTNTDKIVINEKDLFYIISQIYTLCIHDKNLNKIITKYAATMYDFFELYSWLYTTSPIWAKNGNFIPISSFSFEITLSYLLSNKENIKNIDIKVLLNFLTSNTYQTLGVPSNILTYKKN